MDKLSKDELFYLALMMDLRSLYNFCISSKKIYNLIWRRNEIWYYKLQEFPYFESEKQNPRDEYIKLYYEYKKILDIDTELFISIKYPKKCNKKYFFKKIKLGLLRDYGGGRGEERIEGN